MTNNGDFLITSKTHGNMVEGILFGTLIADLDEFGNAVSEKNRVEILNLMVKKGEVTIKDIESELGFTGTNAYYHLTLMLKTEMLKTRTRGRTVLYSINKDYFKRLCDSLTRYLN